MTEIRGLVVPVSLRSAVSYIHMNMVCHRDLKPENFLISKKCEIKESLCHCVSL